MVWGRRTERRDHHTMNEQQATPAAPEPAPGPSRWKTHLRYRVGQVWRTRGGDICTVTEVDEDDFDLPVCTDIFGLRWHPEDPENADYPAELISDPTDFQQ
jgi:hypothetical protein